tara:strand:- start:4631 stop:6130 length:1500 start_codon:yes stop_codon:yes gene_type:complete
MSNLNIIVAHAFPDIKKMYGIGNDGKLPWTIQKDLQHFKNITSKVPNSDTLRFINAVVMGRKTWDSIPKSFKPLPGRINVVITNQDLHDNDPKIIFSKWDDFEKKLIDFQNDHNLKNEEPPIFINEIFIIGGQKIYDLALKEKHINKVYITEVYTKGVFDTFISNINQFKNKFEILEVSKFQYSNNLYYRFIDYINKENRDNLIKWKNIEETNYLNLMKFILENGIERNDRTNTGTISTFGNILKFNLRDTFPLSTTKKMFLRGIFEELKLYLTGKTDNKILQAKNINIWDGNTSREFLDSRNLKHYPEGDMGETYGFNMLHYGGNYIDCHTNYDNKVGFNQLEYVINLIRNNPTSRRIIINLWNPSTLDKATLPSCLCQYQFYVNTQTKELSLQIYIRSSDYFLANNWNTCTGAIFVNLICNLHDIDLTPGDLTVVMGDTHIYKTHVTQVQENLKREPYPFPKLIIKNKKKNITDFEFSDLELIGYRSYPRISAEMSV